MSDDKIFYGTILAMMTLIFGHPGWAFLVFLLAIL